MTWKVIKYWALSLGEECQGQVTKVILTSKMARRVTCPCQEPQTPLTQLWLLLDVESEDISSSETLPSAEHKATAAAVALLSSCFVQLITHILVLCVSTSFHRLNGHRCKPWCYLLLSRFARRCLHCDCFCVALWKTLTLHLSFYLCWKHLCCVAFRMIDWEVK